MNSSIVVHQQEWFARSPPRLQVPAELSPLSAASAGSPGNESDLGESSACGGGGYGGSLIMVQQKCTDTEHAAEAEDQDRLCSVAIDPLPSVLLQSLGARGQSRIQRPSPATATSSCSPSSPPQPTTQEEGKDQVRSPVHDLTSASEDTSATQWSSKETSVSPAPPLSPFSTSEHRSHRKKHRKARRESHDSEGRRKRRKRSTSSSSGCNTPAPEYTIKNSKSSSPRVNPIFVWVTQSEESTITKVVCEDYDKRNRIRLTKTPNGWRAIPRTEILVKNLQQSTNETIKSDEDKNNTCEILEDTESQSESKNNQDILELDDERINCPVEEVEESSNCPEEEVEEINNCPLEVEREEEIKEVNDEVKIYNIETEYIDAKELEDQIEAIEEDIEDDIVQEEVDDDDDDLIVIEEHLNNKKNTAVKSNEPKIEPPPAHLNSTHNNNNKLIGESPADLSQKKKSINSILPYRNSLRLPPLSAKPLPSPLSVNTTITTLPTTITTSPVPCNELRSPNPAHQQLPLTIGISSSCGTPSPAHQHPERHIQFLDTPPISVESKRSPPSTPSPWEPSAKRRRSEDITLRNLLVAGETTKPSENDNNTRAQPRSRLLELLTTSSPPRKNCETNNNIVKTSPPVPPSVPLPTVAKPIRHDALAQLRKVVNEVQVPDPLYVPTSRLAALLASPALEIPRLIRSPPPLGSEETHPVSLSRLKSLLKRPDSELLAWAAQDWAKEPSKLKHGKSHNRNLPPTIPKVPVTMSHKSKTKLNIPSCPPTLPMWSYQKTPHVMPPPPPNPELLAAFHALYGPSIYQNLFSSPPAPTFSHNMPPLWPGMTTLTEAAKPLPPTPVPNTTAGEKPRIMCKNLMDLLATKPLEQKSSKNTKKIECSSVKPQAEVSTRQPQVQPQQQTNDASPKLWHPLFGSQKSNSWNWRQVTVNAGE